MSSIFNQSKTNAMTNQAILPNTKAIIFPTEDTKVIVFGNFTTTYEPSEFWGATVYEQLADGDWTHCEDEQGNQLDLDEATWETYCELADEADWEEIDNEYHPEEDI